MSTIVATNDGAAGALFQSSVQAAGTDLTHLSPLAQLQLAVAQLFTDEPPGTVNASDVSAGTFGAGDFTFPANLTVVGPTLTLSAAGAAFAVAGTTTALTANVASGAITIKGNIGTGTGAVGGFVFQVPVTHGSDSVAQTLTTVLTLDATTVVRATFAGALAITGALTGATTGAFSGAVTIGGATLTLSTAGAAFAIAGTTTALTADVASGAITVKANIGTGAGAVGGIVFQVPVTHGSDSAAQTLTTVLTLGATTVVTAVFAGSVRAPNIGIGAAPTATSPLHIIGLPTSSSGLVTGDVWANSNVLTIIP